MLNQSSVSNNISPTINVPITLDQVAVALRQLSPSELETLELLMDSKAMDTISEGVEEEKQGKLREL